jgi:hypothetical protein
MDNATPILTFHADWRVEQSAPLVADAEVVVRYDKRRLLSAGEMVPAQQHAFTVTGYHRTDGGLAVSFNMGGRPETKDAPFCEHVLRLPRSAGRLELWFQRSGLYGNMKYDSDFGRNYCFEVFPTIDLTSAVRDFVGEVTRQAARR